MASYASRGWHSAYIYRCGIDGDLLFHQPYQLQPPSLPPPTAHHCRHHWQCCFEIAIPPQYHFYSFFGIVGVLLVIAGVIHVQLSVRAWYCCGIAFPLSPSRERGGRGKRVG